MALHDDSRPGWAPSDQDAELSAIFAQMEVGLAQVDLDGRFTRINDRFCEMVGRKRDDLLSLTMTTITHPGDLDETISLFAGAVRDGTPYRTEKRYVRPDGATVWVDNSVSVVRAPDGTVRGLLAASVDVTRRREAEAALRASESRLRLAMDAGRMAVWEYDLQANHILHSRDLSRLVGAGGNGGLPYADFRERIDADDLKRLSRIAVGAMKRGETHFQAEVRYRACSDEIRWLLISAEFQPRADGAADRLIGVTFDITDRKRDEEHLNLVVHELHHRVKNTLTLVQALAHQTFAGSADTARLDAFDGRLVALAAAHSLLNRANWEAAPLCDVIRSAAAPCDPHGARLAISGPNVRVSPRMAVSLTLAIHELCTNAVKYGALSNGSGQVAIDWSVEDGRLKLSWAEQGGPPVNPPQRRGFGSRMLERALAGDLGGTVQLEFAPTGLRCMIEAPDPDANLAHG